MDGRREGDNVSGRMIIKCPIFRFSRPSFHCARYVNIQPLSPSFPPCLHYLLHVIVTLQHHPTQMLHVLNKGGKQGRDRGKGRRFRLE